MSIQNAIAVECASSELGCENVTSIMNSCIEMKTLHPNVDNELSNVWNKHFFDKNKYIGVIHSNNQRNNLVVNNPLRPAACIGKERTVTIHFIVEVLTGLYIETYCVVT
jgi:hypothetical protein